MKHIQNVLVFLFFSSIVFHYNYSQDIPEKQSRLINLVKKINVQRNFLETIPVNQLQSYIDDLKFIRDESNNPSAFAALEKLLQSTLLLKTAPERIKQIKHTLEAESLDDEQLGEFEVVEVDVEKIKHDRFTQSEAHLDQRYIRSLVKQNYDIEMYLNIITHAMAKEAAYKDTHYVFYHALDNVWIATQDVYKKLHAYLFPMTTDIGHFQFLRWGSIGYEGTAQEFLIDQLKNHGLVDDNLSSVRAFLLSVNLALFGNVGYPGECTWEYFMNPKSHAQPNEDIYKSILDVFGIDHKYVAELMKISDLIKTKEQTLLQIFIPKEIVDQIAYVALVRGIPAHEETMDWILKNVKAKNYAEVKPVLDKLTKIYKMEGMQNPAFKTLLEQAQRGDFSVNHLLKIYRNTPWEIKNINYLQARLILTRDVLLNPASGVKFFKYSTITREQRKKYNKRLNELISVITGEFLKKQAEKE